MNNKFRIIEVKKGSIHKPTINYYIEKKYKFIFWNFWLYYWPLIRRELDGPFTIEKWPWNGFQISEAKTLINYLELPQKINYRGRTIKTIYRKCDYTTIKIVYVNSHDRYWNRIANTYIYNSYSENLENLKISIDNYLDKDKIKSKKVIDI